MKTLQIDWPDPENHCFLQNITLHKKNYEKLACMRPKPTLFRRGNFEGMQNLIKCEKPSVHHTKRVLVTATLSPTRDGLKVSEDSAFSRQTSSPPRRHPNGWRVHSLARSQRSSCLHKKNTHPAQANLNTINGSFHNHHTPLDMCVATLILRPAPSPACLNKPRIEPPRFLHQRKIPYFHPVLFMKNTTIHAPGYPPHRHKLRAKQVTNSPTWHPVFPGGGRRA